MSEYKPYVPEQYPDIPNAISEIAYADFKGVFPEVPLAPGVEVGELTAGDSDPFFITLPIAEVGLVSANKLRYTEEFCDSLVDQINTDKPTGIRGHIKEDERRYAYPTPAIYWVGAIRETDGKVWAKGYIPPGATREEYRIKKATAAAAATSIYGKPLMIREHADGSYTPVLSLEQVDLAPPKRAAHGKGYGFAVTREMGMEPKEREPMDKDTLKAVLNELTGRELADLISPAKQAELAALGAPVAEMTNHAAVLAEMMQTVTARESTIAELENKVSTQTGELGKLRTRVMESALDAAVEEATPWHVKSEAGTKKLDFLRGMLKKAAIAELDGSIEPEAIKTAVGSAVAAHLVIVEMTRDVLAGPNALAGAVDNRAAAVNKSLVSDEEAREAADRLGLL